MPPHETRIIFYYETKSIRIKSNNLCYGPKPDDDEIEQYLTISGTGRVWFSAKNFQQFSDGGGYCRKKQLSIGKWKAQFLLNFVDNISEERTFITDVGSYELEIRYANGRKKKISGALIGDVYSHVYGDEDNVDLTRLIRRYIPINGLWVFNGSTSPDYEGKKAIFNFSKTWEEYFKNPIRAKDFEVGFGRECEALGFRMDCGEKFDSECAKRGCENPYGEEVKEVVPCIDDIEIIGSGVFAYWRKLTYWDYMYHLGPKECEVFLCLLRRLKELTCKKR